MFTPVNMKNGGRCNVRKHMDTKNSEQYIALGISLKFGNLYKIKTTSSEPKHYLGMSGKGLITSMDLKVIIRSKDVKGKSFPLLNSLLRIFIGLLRNLRIFIMRFM